MWHEARKQERKIRGMLVDYRKRAERRQDFYEKIKADPTQFIQIHGRRCKIHLDPTIAAAGESPAIMMPWQGQHDNLIDRFDVRAHLDFIAPVPKRTGLEEMDQDERQCNYESYRILAQNDFLSITEDKFLHQLFLEEQFGVNATQADNEKSKKKSGGVAIGYNYDEEGTSADVPIASAVPIVPPAAASGGNSDESDSDIDMDVSIDISKIDTNQAHELNGFGRNYGMQSNDFYSYLTKDADEAEALRIAKEEEQEKIMLSGRKSRRERRAQRERRFAGRPISPPSYAAKEEPINVEADEKNDSDSRSPSPENSGKITYITSFGGEDELLPHSKILINFNKQQKGSGSRPGIVAAGMHGQVSYADKVKQNLEKLKSMNNRRSRSRSRSRSSSPKKPLAYQRYSRSSSRDRIRRSPFDRRKTYGTSGSRSATFKRRYGNGSRSRSRSRNHRRRSSTSSSSSSHSSSSSRRSKNRNRNSKRKRNYSRSSSSSTSSSSTSSYARKKIVAVQKSNSNWSQRSIEKPPTVTKLTQSTEVPLDLPKVPPTPIVIPTPIVRYASKPSPPAPISETKLPEPQVPIKKYYGRKRDDQSSSDESISFAEDADGANSDVSTSTKGSSVVSKQPGTNENKGSHGSTSNSKSFNPRDRLKRKMQILLNKQYKADKLAEIEKTERQVQQQQERDDEMREMALRLRRRQRELRHKYGSPSNSRSSDNSDSKDDDRSENRRKSRNNSRNPSVNRSSRKSRTRSRSTGRRYSRDRDRPSENRHQSPKRRSSVSHSRHSRDRRSRSKGCGGHSRDRRSRSKDRGNPSNGRHNRDGSSIRDNRSDPSYGSNRSYRDDRYPKRLVDY